MAQTDFEKMLTKKLDKAEAKLRFVMRDEKVSETDACVRDMRSQVARFMEKNNQIDAEAAVDLVLEFCASRSMTALPTVQS